MCAKITVSVFALLQKNTDPDLAAFQIEPSACGIHAFTPETQIVSHTAFVGAFAGPFPFYENGKLID